MQFDEFVEIQILGYFVCQEYVHIELSEELGDVLGVVLGDEVEDLLVGVLGAVHVVVYEFEGDKFVGVVLDSYLVVLVHYSHRDVG